MEQRIRIYTILEVTHKPDGVHTAAAYIAAASSADAVREWVGEYGTCGGMDLYVITDESMERAVEHGVNPRVARTGHDRVVSEHEFYHWERVMLRPYREDGENYPAIYRKVSADEARIQRPEIAAWAA